MVRSYQPPSPEQLRAHLVKRNQTITSFRAESVMDYWLGDTRVKGTVWLLGRPGKYLRFNALSPAGDNVVADLACNGTRFAFVDITNNCQRQGVCDRTAIEQFLRISLDPDDFLLLATGGAPVISGEQTLRWDSKAGHEILTIQNDRHIQTIVVDGRKGHWDVVSSSIRNTKNELEWIVENREISPVSAADGKQYRIPKRMRLRQPGEKADLIIHWRQQQLNVSLPDEKFELTPDPSIPQCQPIHR